MEDFSERAAKFFPKSTDWPPPERQRTVSIAEMIAPSSKKKAIRDALQVTAAEMNKLKTEDAKK